MITSGQSHCAKYCLWGRNSLRFSWNHHQSVKTWKDPKDIAAAKLAKASHYPACQLCFENEGYQGRLDHPARANHRIIRFDMDGHDWGFQYSPYAYFNEHCIFLDSQHVPMAISRKTFERLLTIVETFPGYFAGSMQICPIVGGPSWLMIITKADDTPSLWS